MKLGKFTYPRNSDLFPYKTSFLKDNKSKVYFGVTGVNPLFFRMLMVNKARLVGIISISWRNSPNGIILRSRCVCWKLVRVSPKRKHVHIGPKAHYHLLLRNPTIYDVDNVIRKGRFNFGSSTTRLTHTRKLKTFCKYWIALLQHSLVCGSAYPGVFANVKSSIHTRRGRLSCKCNLSFTNTISTLLSS